MSADKRELILDATEKLIASKGLSSLSMQQIAKKAGVAAGTIYLYFKDKTTLVDELQARLRKSFSEAIQRDFPRGAELRKQHEVLWRNILEHHLNNPQRYLVWMQFEAAPKQERELEMIREHYWPLVEFINLGQQQGVLKQVKPELLYALGFGHIAPLCRIYAKSEINLTEQDKDAALQASWDAITIHSH